MSNNSITPPSKVPVSSMIKMNMYAAPFSISPSEPNILKVDDARKRLMMVNFATATPTEVSSFTNYTDGKCTIADLIWWELEEVTE